MLVALAAPCLAVAAAPATHWLWDRSTGALVRGTPALAGSRVIAGSFNGKVVAIDQASGKVAWQFQAGNAVVASPVAADGRVYLAAVDHQLYALQAGSGKVLWRAALDSPALYSPLLHEQTLLVAGGTHVYAFAAGDGRRRWDLAVPQRLAGPPCLESGMAFLVTREASIHALGLADGKVAWTYVDAAFRPVSAVATRRRVIAVAVDGRVRALDARLGRPRWEYRGRPGPALAPVAHGPLVLVPLGSELVALDAVSGIRVWALPLAAPLAMAPVTNGKRVYLLEQDGTLVVARFSDGAVLVQRATGRTLSTPPAVQANRLFFGTRDGRVVALDGLVEQLPAAPAPVLTR